MNFPRASGILLHPTSLPGRFGIGDFGDAARVFVDFLVRAGQTYWQVLPLDPTGWGNSPYSAFSAFAGNTLLISPGGMVADGLLSSEHLENAPNFPEAQVDYGKVYEWKTSILSEAFENFRSAPVETLSDAFEAFSLENSWWLDDYAAFRAIKASQGQKPWYEWAAPLKLRDKSALETVRSQLEREIRAEKFHQFLFARQWLELRKYANENGIKIIGDIPIFVALDSADVWCNQDKFKLNPDGSPKVVAGVPPDFFSKTGQLWGNPIYDWEVMKADNFGWWTARIAFALKTVDIIRLDHFIGFSRNWEVPGGHTTAKDGSWANVPGPDLFSTLKTRFGDLPVIVEDLGVMTAEVANLRDSFGLPGMRILHHGFNGNAFNGDLPHNYPRNCVAYTGTHDNNTTAGWYKSAKKHEREFCRRYLGSNARELHWDMIRAVEASVADTAIIPAQDLLGLGSEARMNLPATGAGNWEWRLSDGALTDEISARLRELSETYARTSWV